MSASSTRSNENAPAKNSALESAAINHESSSKRIHAWALEQRALPQSPLGKAIHYMGGLWPGLVRSIEDPRLAFDNNATKRALRGVVVGRKNHYGSRSERGTEVASLFYSLIESAKFAGVEPDPYLRAAAGAAIRQQSIPLSNELASN